METYHQICTTELLSNCKIVKSGAEGVNKITNDDEDDDDDEDDEEEDVWDEEEDGDGDNYEEDEGSHWS